MDKKCPLLSKKCIKHECAWYTHLVGMNPQTGQPIDEYGCAIASLPILLVENAGEMRKVGAEVSAHKALFYKAMRPEVKAVLSTISQAARITEQEIGLG